jgi:NAD(P)-dependent dehydrogenase (short-subunit alcohol dehydrogenase family)
LAFRDESAPASKWALGGFSETLCQEVEPFGIKVLMVEPSGFRTDWAGASMDRAEPIDAYAGVDLQEFRAGEQVARGADDR